MKDEFVSESGGLRTETWRAIHCRFTSETSVAHHRLRVIQNGAHMNAELEPCAREALLGKLERALIDDYLDARGYDPVKLAGLPELERETSGGGFCLRVRETGGSRSAIALPRRNARRPSGDPKRQALTKIRAGCRGRDQMAMNSIQCVRCSARASGR
jgi:hypothetical protein